MKHKTLIDRLVTLALVGAVLAAYQMGSRSGASSASGEALAAGTAAQAGTGYISVPAAAFVPNHYLVDYNNVGQALLLNAGAASFYAPLHLPHGATVTKMTLNFNDSDATVGNHVLVRMYRTKFAAPDKMAQVQSTDIGESSLSDTLIENAVVDNSQYAYFISLDLGSDTVTLYEVLIEFTYPTTFLPLTLRNY